MEPRARGLTLIELMIAIVLLAIFSSIPWNIHRALRSIQRESAYRQALRSAQRELVHLRREDFRQLPPEVVRLDAHGRARLAQRHLVPGSVSVRGLDGKALKPGSVDCAAGTLRVAGAAGRRVVVSYAFAAPDTGEQYLVGPKAVVRLQNRPVEQVVGVWLAHGSSLRRVSDWKLVDPTRGLLRLPSFAAGGVAVVDSLGLRARTRVSGQFLDLGLHPTASPGPVKLLRVAERFGGSWRMRLSLVKVAHR